MKNFIACFLLLVTFFISSLDAQTYRIKGETSLGEYKTFVEYMSSNGFTHSIKSETVISFYLEADEDGFRYCGGDLKIKHHTISPCEVETFSTGIGIPWKSAVNGDSDIRKFTVNAVNRNKEKLLPLLKEIL